MLSFLFISNKSSVFFLFLTYGVGDKLKACTIYGLFQPKTKHVRNTSNFFKKPICVQGGAGVIITYSPDATDVWVWVTAFLQLCSPGPCAGGSSHPVSLCCLAHLQTSSEPGKRGSLHSFQNDPKGILYKESLWKGGEEGRKGYTILEERKKCIALL